jgi:hypothetical protein
VPFHFQLYPSYLLQIFMAIISSVLKLVNVGGAVNDDEQKDKKEDNSMFSSDSEEVNFFRIDKNVLTFRKTLMR